MKLHVHADGMRREPPRGYRFVWRAVLVVLLIAFSYSSAPRHVASAAESGVNEFTIKAAYISKFGSFIRWPDGTFSSDTSPITICVLGDNAVGTALSKVATRPIGSQRIVIRSVKVFVAGDGCNILYAADTDLNRIRQTLKAAHGAAVLTVTDVAEGGAASVINFVLRDNRVKFEIDERAASESGLTISSQLLGLAVSVRAREGS